MLAWFDKRLQRRSWGRFLRFQVSDEGARQRSKGRVIRENANSKQSAWNVASMTKEQHEDKRVSWMDSRLWRTLLVIVAAFLTFVGPTYFVYAAVHALDLNFAISMASGSMSKPYKLGRILFLYNSTSDFQPTIASAS